MGSLASRPKVPAPKPLPVYMAPPLPPMPAPVVNTPTPPSAVTPSDEERQAEARSMALLDRRRGAFSTVLTGFRGLLNTSNSSAQRKTLLGE